jgi:hypothetical protein
MIYPHEQFAIKHMGWTEGDTEPTEQAIIEAKEKHEAANNAKREAVYKKLGLTTDEVAALLS